jgi:hypothetical protein
MKKIQLWKTAIAMACTLALVLAVLVISTVPAKTQERVVKAYAGRPMPNQETPQEQPLVVTNKHVGNTTYYASSNGATASCGTAFCIATPANIFTQSIQCPGAIGVKCTFEVDVAGQHSVFPAGEDGLYQFLIDGAIPTGGGTDGSGFYAWEIFGAGGEYTSAYSVTSQVQNTVASQFHSVVVNIGCQDIEGNAGGCSDTAGFTNLTIRQFKP